MTFLPMPTVAGVEQTIRMVGYSSKCKPVNGENAGTFRWEAGNP